MAFTNGESNGERVVLYHVRLSTDPDLNVIVHEATGIPGDPSGQTTYELPMGLVADQMYYWHAQADDGVNTSEASPLGCFEI